MASPEGVSVQTIKLKILYTFDQDSKDNHLARWPHLLDVNTCFIDNASQIGVVDLRTCLEAVINASPELTSRVDQDYAVYAYDYSEEDTPLVGQGMLSKTLAMQDEVVEQDNEAMITGKIAKGMMGLLSKNAQPTLEVKLRFRPVTITPGQRMRSGSISSNDGRPAWLQNDNNLSQTQTGSVSPMDTTGLQTMQRMLSEGAPPRERTGSMAPDSYVHCRPGSRAGTPSAQTHTQPQRQPPDAYSRPVSRAGMHQPTHARRDSFNSGYYSGEENVDDGPARKRAKTSKVDWPTKSNFNIERQPDSLRVAASTAQSVRIHRPIAMNPVQILQAGTPGEEPVRPPTPIPTAKGGKPRGRPRKITPSSLAPAPPSQNPVPSLNVPPQSDAMETAASSPEDLRPRSASTTPANIPSSPPIIHEQQGPLITSPALPPMPMMNHHDSGFMSGNFEDLFDESNILQFDDFIMDKPQNQQRDLDFKQNDVKISGQHYTPVFDEGNDVEPALQSQRPPPVQATKISIPPPPPPPPPPPRPVSRAQSFTPAARPGMSSPKLAPAPIPRARQIMEEQRAKGLLPQLPASEPGGRSLQRANTWAPDHSDALMSEAPDGDEQKPRSKKKVGKEQTKARLENAIAAGEMPPYCDNCGSIETPAWRRGYAKLFECAWADVETSLGHGGVVFKEEISHNADGSIKEFRGYKTDKIPGDEHDGWKQICLCNPCGLWFHKQKCPRPKEKWQKKTDPKNKRKRGHKGPQGQKKQPNAKSDAPTPMSDDSSPADTATEAPDYYDNENEYDETNTGEDETTDSNEPQLPLMPHNMRANSAEPRARGLAAPRITHLPAMRQIRSSPGQARGSETEPIEVDLTPKPTRRQLFPSPDKPQQRSDPMGNAAAMKALADLPRFVRRSPRLNKTKDIFQVSGMAGAIALTADGKENIMPEIDLSLDADLDALFDTGIDEHPLPPTTPTPTRRSERLIMKTPQRQFGYEISPNAQRTPTYRTPKQKDGQHPVTRALLGTANAKKDPSDLTPFSLSIEGMLNGAYDSGVSTSPNQKGSKRTTPGKNVLFNFPDLPSLKNSSPMNAEQMLDINFSELPTDHLQSQRNDPFSTDGAVPSSPPGFFAFINSDGLLADNILWEDSANAQQGTEFVYPDPEGLSMAPPPTQVLRRSPRKSR